MTIWRLLHIHYGLIYILFMLKLVYLQRGPREFPIHDQKPLKGHTPSSTPGANPKDVSMCSRCHDMFTLSEKEFKTSKNSELFCIRLLQVKRCIKKIREYNHCTGIALFALDTGVYIKMGFHNCARMKVNANSIVNIFKELKKKRVEENNKENAKCRYVHVNRTLSEQRHCGMFGDPHVKTFYDIRQTCVVAGAWSLLDNDYMAVQVTNQIVQATEVTSATATSKIVVIYKETGSSCIKQKIYEATSSNLPSVFKDSTTFSGPDNCRTVIEKQSENKISIQSCHINTTVIIRKVGSYLTFNIRTPYELVNQSRGLCHSGCPANELVDSTSYFENKLNEVSTSDGFPSTKEAMRTCSEANLTDFYYDSCVFDLLTTGDKLFSNAANNAMLDAISLDPKLRLRRDNSVVLKTQSKYHANRKNSSSHSTSLYHKRYILISTLLFTLCVLRTR